MKTVSIALACFSLAFAACSSGDTDGESTESGSAAALAAPFQFLSADVEACPFDAYAGSATDAPLSCATHWPTSGTVYRMRSSETFAGATIQRTWHMHVPHTVNTRTPVVIFMHGGTNSGLEFMGARRFWELTASTDPSTPSVVTAPLNSNQCRYLAYDVKSDPRGNGAFRRPNAPAQSCAPYQGTYTNSAPFIAVYPDGVLDASVASGDENDPYLPRHWEDGRLPSPGQSDTTNAPVRDDVGFVNHVIEVLRKRRSVDASAIYVAGYSNGGLMTHRLACNAGNPAYPSLARIAAFSMQNATISEYARSHECGQYQSTFALQMVVGKDVSTYQPPCGNPQSPACWVNGDYRMPYGASGGLYAINNPGEPGLVISIPDAEAWWAGRIAPGAAAVWSAERYFTSHGVFSSPGSAARFEVYETTLGHHGAMSSRADIEYRGRTWRFLSSFRKASDGTLSYSEPTWIAGEL